MDYNLGKSLKVSTADLQKLPTKKKKKLDPRLVLVYNVNDQYQKTEIREN